MHFYQLPVPAHKHNYIYNIGSYHCLATFKTCLHTVITRWLSGKIMISCVWEVTEDICNLKKNPLYNAYK